jgi:RNA recognition motif-containing protein
MPAKLYIGNLSYRVTEEDLVKKFSEAGRCLLAKIIVDNFTGKSRGFAFVEMASDEEAREAIKKLNRTSIYGRGIIVSEAQARENRRR